MPVTGTEFILIALPYLAMLFIPYITIRKLSTNLGIYRNKFDIVSASIFYPFVFIFASYFSYFIQQHFELGILSVYISFLVAFIWALFFTWMGYRYVVRKIN